MSAKKIENKVEESTNPEVVKAEENNAEVLEVTEEPKAEENNAEVPEVTEEPKAEENNAEDPEVPKKEEKKATKSTKVKLKILVAFTDKYTQVDYKINDVINVDPTRAEELLSDERGLVEKVN